MRTTWQEGVKHHEGTCGKITVVKCHDFHGLQSVSAVSWVKYPPDGNVSKFIPKAFAQVFNLLARGYLNRMNVRHFSCNRYTTSPSIISR